jgi:hypothetical protein
VLAFTINLQGGSPEGYSKEQPWFNSGIEADGSLNTNYLRRLEQVLDRADDLGMVAIVGIFYFGQDERIKDEAAVTRVVDNVVNWLFDRGYRNVLLEINNECNVGYHHAILKPDRVHELINRVRDTTRKARRFYVGTSYGGGAMPEANVARVSDFLLLHGNGVSNPDKISEMVRQARKISGAFTKPILFNEDDHFDFEKPTNNFVAAISEYASWGYFDPGTNNYRDGYQCPPVNWGLNTERKRAFFRLAAQMTSSEWVPPEPEVLPKGGTPGIVSVTSGEYHGWTNCYFMNNGQAVVIIVPAIGRVMQFGYAGEEGVFWENRQLDGKLGDWDKGWMNFGGDKAWPSPENDWWKFTQVEWRPPPAFDGSPMEAALDGTDVILTSGVDRFYSIKVKRRVHLEPNTAVMTITTYFERTAGDPAQMGVEIVTQLKDPKRVYAPLPAKPTKAMPNKYVLLGKDTPPDMTVDSTMLGCSRSTDGTYKVGIEAGTLVWVGDKNCLRIDSPRMANVLYPDKGSRTEINTSADPLKYVDLVTLGPLYMMARGHRIEHVTTYTLSHRTEQRPDSEARKILFGESPNTIPVIR